MESANQFELRLIAPQGVSNARRYVLFATFCVANMLDAYNLNALFTALPVLKRVFALDEADASWVMSAFELTYASFLLIVRAPSCLHLVDFCVN